MRLIHDVDKIRDLSPLLLDANGNLKVVPASVYEQTTTLERYVFGHKNAVYNFPTTELIEHLREIIGDRSAIEIGAGNGVMAKALGIPATDSRQQERPEIIAHYELLRQPVIRYGDNVEKLDAHDAIRKYRPQVVVATWVTQKFDPSKPELGGNVDGVVEEWVIQNVQEYLFIGNLKTHATKTIWSLPHTKQALPFLYSRSMTETPNFIARFFGPGAQ
ncbi:hypothetical protein [Comamonas thiooxydans]|uniref:hypothetical protein n=1 Tax=Comamonas thiooxydans TaxID=363952 RepID=UPI000B41D4FB|nr:hypothetical protein [Comamonas thiooxydans]